MKIWILIAGAAALLTGCATYHEEGMGAATYDEYGYVTRGGASSRGELDLGPGERDATESRSPNTGLAVPRGTGQFMPDYVTGRAPMR